MSIDFPSPPTINQIFTSGNQSWQWDGSVWMIVSPVPAAGIFAPLAGATFTGQANGIAPTAAANLTRKDYVDSTLAAALAQYLLLTGGTLTGALTLQNPQAMITLRDTDTGVGGLLTTVIRMQDQNGAQTGFVGFNNFASMVVRAVRNDVYLSADSDNATAGSLIHMEIDGVEAAQVSPAGTVSPATATVITREKGDVRYAQLAAATNTLTGILSIANTTPQINFTDTDSVPGGALTAAMRIFYSDFSLAGTIGFNNTDQIIITTQRGNILLSADPANVSPNSFIQMNVDNALAGRLEPAGTAAIAATSIITREKGDARYAQLSGPNVLTGLLSLAAGSVTAPSLNFAIEPTTGMYRLPTGISAFASAGVLTARIEAPGVSAPATTSVMTREKGDARYPQLAAANTFTNQTQTIAAASATLNLNSVNTLIGTAQVARIQFLGQAGVVTGLLGYDGSTALNITSARGIVSITADNDNLVAGSFIQLRVDGTTAGRIDPVGTTSPVAATVITREKGDARYAPIASDRRLKTDIQDMPDGAYDTLMALHPVSYEWIEDEDDPRPTGTRYGLIAQEVQVVMPSAVLGTPQSLGLDPLALIGVLIKTVQMLAARVSQLEEQV